jgi:hypothetical protein
MSDDVFGEAVRALYHVPADRLGICRLIAEALRGANGGIWHEIISARLTEGLPESIDFGNVLKIVHKHSHVQVEGKRIEDCFENGRTTELTDYYSYLATTIQSDLGNQPPISRGMLDVVELQRDASLREVMQRIIGFTGDTKFLLESLVRDDSLVTLPLIEQLVRLHEKSEMNVGLSRRISQVGYCFFVLNRRGEPSVVTLSKPDKHGWQVYVHPASSDSAMFKRRTRFFIRNM